MAADKVQVRLLVSRTNVGAIGDVVTYDAETARQHAEWGLVAIVDDKPAPEKPASKRQSADDK